MSASRAHADAVLLLEAPGLRSGLCLALRIQLTDVADVRCQPEPPGAPLSARLAHAATAATGQGARLGVLLERDPDPHLVRMYLVGARSERAVIALERIEDRADADVDRSLALEVRSALEALVATSSTAPAGAPEQLAPVLATPASLMAASPAWSALLEAGGALMLGTQRRSAGVVAIGARRTRDRRFAELALRGRWLSRTQEELRPGVVRQSAWGAALEARAGRTFRFAEIGGLLAVGAERVSARGTTRDGSTGSATLGLAHVAAGLDLRVFLMRGASLRLTPTLALHPVAQRFALDQQVVSTLGRLRVELPLTLLVTLPLHEEEHADAR